MATQGSHITNIGNIIYTNYSLWLILVSLILLLTLIGTIVIVMTPRTGSGSSYSIVNTKE